MNKIYRVVFFAALFLISAASLPSFADTFVHEVGQGTVLNELSEADALKLDKELQRVLQRNASAPPTFKNLLYTPEPLRSEIESFSQSSDGGLLKVHTIGCHRRACLPPCPQCAANRAKADRHGNATGHCRRNNRYFSCTINVRR